MIQVEHNPRGNASGTGASSVTLVTPANDAEMLTDVVPEETEGGSFKQQGWIPMVARRQNRMQRLALLDGVNTTPNTEEQANGIGIPTESLSGNFRGIRPENVSYESLLDQRKKRFPKITNPNVPQDDLGNMGIEDMTL
jgi:hypothetical protein